MTTPGRLGLVAAVAAFLFMLPRLGTPWGTDLASINGGFYMLSEMRAFEASGFRALSGIPHLGSLPTDPPIGNPYAHHPPGWPALLFAVTRITGIDPFGLRLLPAMAAAAMIGVLACWMARHRAPAGVVLLVLLSRPILHLYGPMPNPESMVALLIVLGLFLDELRREGHARAELPLLIVVAAAPWMDWQGAFLAPAIFVRSMLERRPLRTWRTEMLVALAGTASVVALVAWLGHVVIHLDEIRRTLLGETPNPDASGFPLLAGWRHMMHVATGSSHATVAEGAVAWWKAIGTHFATLIGSWIFIAAFFAFGRQGPSGARLAALALPGILNLALFRLHAFNHDFWVVHLLPAAAWMFTAASVGISRDPRIRVLPAALLAATGAITIARTVHLRDATVPDVERVATGLATLVRPGVASAWTVPVATASRHLRGHVVDLPVAEIPRLIAFSQAGTLTAPVDVFVPRTPDALAAAAALPKSIRVVEIPLTPDRDPEGATAARMGSDAVLRLEIPVRMR